MNGDFASDLEELEAALRASSEGVFVLKLYVSGSSSRSAKAISHMRAICEEHLAGRYELEVIDLYQQPELAREINLLAAPTLIRERPEPIRRLVGDFSDEDRVLYSLNIVRHEG